MMNLRIVDVVKYENEMSIKQLPNLNLLFVEI